MGSVVSATLNATQSKNAWSAKSEQFYAAAEHYLAQAHAHFEDGIYDIALEDAYRAALKVAGAVCLESTVIQKRKRLPSSAWEKLQLTGARGKYWAAVFRRYSPLRGRVASGIVHLPDADTVVSLLADVERFYGEVRPDWGLLQA